MQWGAGGQQVCSRLSFGMCVFDGDGNCCSGGVGWEERKRKRREEPMKICTAEVFVKDKGVYMCGV